MRMIKINSYYSEQQVDQIVLLVKATGIKQSEHLRRAVDLYLKHMREQGLLDDTDLQVPTESN